MQKLIIAAAAASVLSLASYGFAQTTLVRQNFETDTSRRGINFNSMDPANNNIPANVGTTSVSNPSFGPATGLADSQDNVEIIDPAAAFNAFAGSNAADLNSRGLNAPFTLTGNTPVTVSFDYGIDNQGGTGFGPRSAQVAISSGSNLDNFVVGPVSSGSVTSVAGGPAVTASFSQTYNLGAGSYTLQIASNLSTQLRGIQIDNLSVTAVPEPASLGLLGLGGLTLLRRRRA